MWKFKCCAESETIHKWDDTSSEIVFYRDTLCGNELKPFVIINFWGLFSHVMVLVWFKKTDFFVTTTQIVVYLFIKKSKEFGHIFISYHLPPDDLGFCQLFVTYATKYFFSGGIDFFINLSGSVTHVTTKILPVVGLLIRVTCTKLYILHRPSCENAQFYVLN